MSSTSVIDACQTFRSRNDPSPCIHNKSAHEMPSDLQSETRLELEPVCKISQPTPTESTQERQLLSVHECYQLPATGYQLRASLAGAQRGKSQNPDPPRQERQRLRPE